MEIDPRYAVAWHNRGFTLNNLERYEEAILCYDKVLVINPKDADAWYEKGAVLNNLERYEEAILCYNKALEINSMSEQIGINKKFTEEKLREKKEKEQKSKAEDAIETANAYSQKVEDLKP